MVEMPVTPVTPHPLVHSWFVPGRGPSTWPTCFVHSPGSVETHCRRACCSHRSPLGPLASELRAWNMACKFSGDSRVLSDFSLQGPKFLAMPNLCTQLKSFPPPLVPRKGGPTAPSLWGSHGHTNDIQTKTSTNHITKCRLCFNALYPALVPHWPMLPSPNFAQTCISSAQSVSGTVNQEATRGGNPCRVLQPS